MSESHQVSALTGAGPRVTSTGSLSGEPAEHSFDAAVAAREAWRAAFTDARASTMLGPL